MQQDGPPTGAVTIVTDALKGVWGRIRAFRRLRFTRTGGLFTGGALLVGIAATNTSNNLLILLLGAMLGIIAVSGWLSERVIRSASVTRDPVRSGSVGAPIRLGYRVAHRGGLFPTVALEIQEEGLPGIAFLPYLPQGGIARVSTESTFTRRGVYPLSALTLRTGFPFGLFQKARDLEIPGEIVVFPRTDRPVREATVASRKRPTYGVRPVNAAGGRGEYRGLRAYRPGDDPRDIHWRSTARLGSPVMREYEHEGGPGVWICLDLDYPPGDRAEEAVEIAAALAARAHGAKRPFGLATPQGTVPAGAGPGQLDAVLEALARVDFRPGTALPTAPAPPQQCVLVSAGERSSPGAFGDVLTPGEEVP
jgi:uncharacterized protein (DUF58 family)